MRRKFFDIRVILAVIVGVVFGVLLAVLLYRQVSAPPPERPQVESIAGTLGGFLPIAAVRGLPADVQIADYWLTDGGFTRQCWRGGMQSWNVVNDPPSQFHMIRAQELNRNRRVAYDKTTGEIVYHETWEGFDPAGIYLISNEPDNCDPAAGDCLTPAQYADMITKVERAGVPRSRMVVGQMTFPHAVPAAPPQFPHGSGATYLEAAGLANSGGDFYAFSFHHYDENWYAAGQFRRQTEAATDWARANGFTSFYMTETGHLGLTQADDWTDTAWEINGVRNIVGLQAVTFFTAWPQSQWYTSADACALSAVGQQVTTVNRQYERALIYPLGGYPSAFGAAEDAGDSSYP